MEEEHIVNQITRRGIIIANRLRIVIVVLFGVLVTAGTATNPMIINIAFFTTLAVFLFLSLFNYAVAARGKEYISLKYITVVIEVTSASLLKTAHAFLGNYPQVVNESVIFSIYWLFILLSLLQNRTRLSIFAGAMAAAEYSALILISIFVWKVPVIVGNELPGYLVLDNEIAKVLLLIGFTWTGTLILRNLNGFALDAYNNGKTAQRRTVYLEEIISRDNRKISGGQKQRLLLAMALANDPELIFLDESPISALSPSTCALSSSTFFWLSLSMRIIPSVVSVPCFCSSADRLMESMEANCSS